MKYIESFITSIDTLLKVQTALLTPDTFEAHLLTISKKKDTAVLSLNCKLKPLDYELKSKMTDKKVVIDGKRTSQRTYKYCLELIPIADNFK